MKYLFIDTSADNLIIGIIKDDNVIYFNNILNGKDTSSKVMPILDEAFNKSGLNIKDIDKIFVVNGPGSFTGIRVGVTIAKTIGFCLNIPLIPLSELELLATTNTDTNYNVSLIDARRGYVYGAIYDKNLDALVKDNYILLEELQKKYPDSYTVVTSANARVDLIKIIKKHEMDEAINSHQLKPNYLKKTEAEENLND